MIERGGKVEMEVIDKFYEWIIDWLYYMKEVDNLFESLYQWFVHLLYRAGSFGESTVRSILAIEYYSFL